MALTAGVSTAVGLENSERASPTPTASNEVHDTVGVRFCSRWGKRGGGGTEDESGKLFIETQGVQVPSHESRSGQVSSEHCRLPGDWQARSVCSEEAGRED